MATRRRHTPDQIIRKLAEGNKLLAGGAELDEVCRHLQIAESTWHRWLAQYGGMKANDAKRFKSNSLDDVEVGVVNRSRLTLSFSQPNDPVEVLRMVRTENMFPDVGKFDVDHAMFGERLQDITNDARIS